MKTPSRALGSRMSTGIQRVLNDEQNSKTFTPNHLSRASWFEYFTMTLSMVEGSGPCELVESVSRTAEHLAHGRRHECVRLPPGSMSQNHGHEPVVRGLLVNLVKESVRLELAYVVEIPELHWIPPVLDVRINDLSNAIGIV